MLKVLNNIRCKNNDRLNQYYLISLFMLPYIYQFYSGNDQLTYRLLSIIWCFYGLVVRARYLKLAFTDKTHNIFLIILVLNLVFSYFSQLNVNYEKQIISSSKSIMIILILLIFKTFLKSTWTDVLKPIQIIAQYWIVGIFITATLFGEYKWGRLSVFGHHPNLISEITTFLNIILINMRNSVKFYLISACTLVLSFEVEMRAATVSIILLFICRLALDIKKWNISISLVILGIVYFLSTVFLIIFVTGYFDLILNDVFLINDPFRGLNSGFSGRLGTWKEAINIFRDAPFFGIGLGQTRNLTLDFFIHSAPMLLLSEFGSLSLIILGIVVFKMYFIIRQKDFELFSIILCSLPLLLFQARSIDINIFPILLWILIFWSQLLKPKDNWLIT